MSPFKLWVYRRLTSWLPESRGYEFKTALLRWAGAKIGRNVSIYSSTLIVGNGALEIGDDVHIGALGYIHPVAPAGITIESHADIGPRVTLLTGSHEIDPSGDHIGGKGIVAPVTIGSGSWLGARATILPGVTLPPKTLVAAGAVVTKFPLDLNLQPQPPTSGLLLAGIPATVKKTYQ